MQHRLFFSSVVAVVLALFMGASAAAQSGSNSKYYQFADTAAATISSPAAGRVRLFFDSTGFYWKNSAGVSTALGGSGITGLTAAVIPAVATGGSSLEDSKMTTSVGGSSTGKGVWTLYDDTGSNLGNTTLRIRPGSAQDDSGAWYPLIQIMSGSTGAALGSYPLVATTTGEITRVSANEFVDSSGIVGFSLTYQGLLLGSGTPIKWNSSTAYYNAADVGIAYAGTGILAVTDGSTGQGGIGLSDAATNTVSDALILRHATSGTAAASFGTGLLFQGEDAAGNMQDMASIDAVYTDAADGSEDSKLVLQTIVAGAMTDVVTITANLSTGSPGISAAGNLHLVSGADMALFAASGIAFAPSGGGGAMYFTSSGLGAYNNNTYDIGGVGGAFKSAYVSTSIQGTRTQAISDNAAAATFVTIAVPTSDTTVGGRIFYTITAIDAGTAIQTKTGTYSFGLNNIGGTVTGNGTDVLEHSQLSTGTLAPTFSVNISGTNAQFQLVLDTSLDAAAETLKIEYRVQIDSGTATVTPAT